MTRTIPDMLDDLAVSLAPLSYICLAIINEAGESAQSWHGNAEELAVVQMVIDAAKALEDLRGKIKNPVDGEVVDE